MTAPLRLVFAGSPAAAVPSLRTLLDGPHDVIAVVTREDSPQGRKRILTPTPVARLAEKRGVRVIRANRLGGVADELVALRPDLGVVVAYGGLIREPLLSAPPHGWINLHFSLLPRWRGAAPVQHALIAGDAETGVAVFRLVEELDAGPVFATRRHAIGEHETAGQLLDVLADVGAEVLAGVVDDLAGGTARAEPQRGHPTSAPKLGLADARLDWSEPAGRVAARIRGVTPEPGAFTILGGERLKILGAEIARDDVPLPPGRFALRGRDVHAGTRDVPLRLAHVQPAGKRPMPAADWWRGRPPGAADTADAESPA